MLVILCDKINSSNVEIVKFIITIGTAIGGIIVFLKGLKEYQTNNKIKRAEFLEKLIIEFLDTKNKIALRLLDDFIFVSKNNRKLSNEEQINKSVHLANFLRDHLKSPIINEDEIQVRDSFDNLFDFFTKLSYYLNQNIISPKELSYFKYYLKKIEKKQEVIEYIKRYYDFEDFKLLFESLK